MTISAFDLFKIGIGPSSSHTVGPMRAAGIFVTSLAADGEMGKVAGIRVELFGSLGATGHGHGSVKAVVLGLTGAEPETVDPAAAGPLADQVRETGRLRQPTGQVENAAEIGVEHNLGLTCDPVGGLVQIPCIERNAIASVKAITAARMAVRGDGQHHVSLDKAIKTMRETGADMKDKYKETARGGLAVNVIEC